MAATNPSRRVLPHLVQLADGWPLGEEGWTTQRRLIATTGSEGVGQLLGDFNLEQDTGRVGEPNGRRIEQVGTVPVVNPDGTWKSLVGKWVRILLASATATGAVEVNGLPYDILWHGVVSRPAHQPDGAAIVGGPRTWQCLGLADTLDRIYLWRGYEWYNGQMIDPGACPVFNDLPGGDRSADTHDINGFEVYAFERGALATGPGARVPWTARTCIEHVLAAFSRGVLYGADVEPVGPVWSLGAGADMLDFEIDRLDMAGRSITELLNTLVNPSRGLTWRPRVVDGEVQIVITSTNRDAVTIIVSTTTPSGPTSTEITIPAAEAVVDDLRGDIWLDNPGIQEESDYYDWITLHAARPWVTITLWWEAGNPLSSIIPDGWETSDQPGSTPETEHRWRRWKLNPAWTGEQYPAGCGVGLRHTMPYDTTGASGARTFGGFTPPPSMLEVTRHLPYAQGFAAFVDGPRQSPLVVIGGGTGTWADMSKYIDVTPTEQPAGIMLGPSEDTAHYLKKRLTSGGNKLLVTVGIREWAPFTVAWRRQGERQRDLPRILQRTINDCEQWSGLQGTVKGVSNGTLQTVAAYEFIRDDAPSAAGMLALLAARYGGTGASYGYGIDGHIDIEEASAPGTFVSDAQLGGLLLPVNALMTRRAWDLRFESYGTTYRFERLPLDARSRP